MTKQNLKTNVGTVIVIFDYTAGWLLLDNPVNNVSSHLCFL